MSKSIRIYELARKLGVQSKEILRILQEELHIDIQNHMSTINDQVARRITQILRGEQGPPPAAVQGNGQENRQRSGPAEGPRGGGTAPVAKPGGNTTPATPTAEARAGGRPAGSADASPRGGAAGGGHGGRSEPGSRGPSPRDLPGRPSSGAAAGNGQGGRSMAGDAAVRGRSGSEREGARNPQPAGAGGFRRPEGSGGDRRPRGAGDERRGPREGGRIGVGDGRQGTNGRLGTPGGRAPRGPGRPAGAGTRPGTGPRPAGGGGRPGGGPRPLGGRPGGGFAPPRPAGGRPGAGARPAAAGRRGGKRRQFQRDERDFRDEDDEGRLPGGRKEERRRRREQEESPREIRHGSRVGGEVTLTGAVTVGAFSELLGLKPAQVIQTLIGMGIMAAINQEIDATVAAQVAEKFGFTVKIQQPELELARREERQPEDDPSKLVSRWPVVTVLGHVDHGKTSLLDRIRKTRVTAQEAGGITQHIGASTVEVGDKKIVFLDTPGHEAFTALRARGAEVTDIAVLVVAADDGVMPQTVEAINHARAAGVPLVVAITKVDKPEANPDRVRQQLVEYQLVPEEWGGDTVMVEVSAHTGQGIDELLEMILLVAELQELKANPDRPAVGTVIEARLDRGRGPVATVLVQNGTLRIGDNFVCGTTYGRVRAMFDDHGRSLNEAGPSTPVEVLGASDVPEAGDRLEVVESERQAREMAEARRAAREQEDTQRAGRGLTLEQLAQQGEAGERELRLVVKADVQGSLDALVPALERLSNEEVYVRILHTGLGAVSESDVMLAAVSRAIVLGFNVRPDANARRAAEAEGVEIRTYRVIYELLDDVKAALQGLLKPEIREVVIGQAEVRATFRVPGVGTVAGCYVTDGKIARNARVRVIRDGTVVHEGRIASLKRFRDDVREVAQGYECGVGLERFNDIKEGDILEIFQEQEVARALPG